MNFITPCLWFDDEAEAAAKFYTAIFPHSKITNVSHYPEGMPRPAGMVMVVQFELDGQPFMALNGGPDFKFNMAISLVTLVDTQDELDRINAALLEGGGQQIDCGWVTDKYGVSWQVTPRILHDLSSGDPAGFQRMMAAMLTMKKLDIAALKQAYHGGKAD